MKHLRIVSVVTAAFITALFCQPAFSNQLYDRTFFYPSAYGDVEVNVDFKVKSNFMAPAGSGTLQSVDFIHTVTCGTSCDTNAITMQLLLDFQTSYLAALHTMPAEYQQQIANQAVAELFQGAKNIHDIASILTGDYVTQTFFFLNDRADGHKQVTAACILSVDPLGGISCENQLHVTNASTLSFSGDLPYDLDNKLGRKLSSIFGTWLMDLEQRGVDQCTIEHACSDERNGLRICTNDFTCRRKTSDQ